MEGMDTRILYVEDDPGLARIVQKRLSRFGCTVKTAPDGVKGLQILADEPFDCLLVDHEMPLMEGLEVVRTLSTQNRLIPTIMITGAGNERIAVEAMKLGVSDYLVKDVEGLYLELLPSIIEQVLRQQTLRKDREQAEEALAKSEERLRELADMLPCIVYEMDLNGRLTFVNRTASEMTGYTSEEYAKLTIPNDLLVPEDLIRAKMEIKNLIEGHPRSTPQDTYRVRHKDGSILPIMVRSSVIWRDGRPIGLRGVILDDTERQRTERWLRLQHDLALRLSTTSDISEAMKLFLKIVLQIEGIDCGGVYLVAPPGNELKLIVSEGLRYPPPPVIRQIPDTIEGTQTLRENRPLYYSASDSIPALDGFRQAEGFKASVVIPVVYQNRMIAVASLASRSLDVIPPSIRNLLESMVIPLGGILERAQTETLLRENRNNLQSLFNTLEDFLFILNTQGRLLYWNPVVEQRLGYSPEELSGMSVLELHPPERRIEAAAIVQKVLIGQLASCPIPLQTRTGTLIPVETKATRGTWNNQPVIIGISRDMTERQNAEKERHLLEAQVQHAQKLESLGILAGGIAHDFNNLLTVILGNTELMTMDLKPGSPALSSLKEIERAGKHAAEISRQMLAYSGKGRFIVERLNLNEIIWDMRQLLDASIAKKTTLRIKLADPLPAIEADATQLRQVIINLVSNASEALKDNIGEVIISTGTAFCDRKMLGKALLGDQLVEGTYVSLTVTDTGCGMNASTVEKIFDPFFTTKFTGRGLGLAVVLGIVRGHRAAIKVDSVEGMGTTFQILFPLPDETMAPQPPQHLAETTATWKGEGTILLVDDESKVLEVSRRMLEYAGFTVIPAADGAEALDLFRKNHASIKAVVLDFTMPVMDGEETYYELIALDKKACILFTSGYNAEESISRFARQGFVDFIQKPYSANALLNKLHHLIEQKAAN
jgi:two-component system cell cycle sensor histidine kinase/response regulator CckA